MTTSQYLILQQIIPVNLTLPSQEHNQDQQLDI